MFCPLGGCHGCKEPVLTDFEPVDWGYVDRPVVVDGEIVIRPMMQVNHSSEPFE
jgi:hypothetical protein